jgi:hypothetical protein
MGILETIIGGVLGPEAGIASRAISSIIGEAEEAEEIASLARKLEGIGKKLGDVRVGMNVDTSQLLRLAELLKEASHAIDGNKSTL